MIKAKVKKIQNESEIKSGTIEKLLKIYKSNDLKIERNEQEIEELKKRLGDIN